MSPLFLVFGLGGNGSAKAPLLAITNSTADPQNVLPAHWGIGALRTPVFFYLLSDGFFFALLPAIPYACGLERQEVAGWLVNLFAVRVWPASSTHCSGFKFDWVPLWLMAAFRIELKRSKWLKSANYGMLSHVSYHLWLSIKQSLSCTHEEQCCQVPGYRKEPATSRIRGKLG